jgi:hypothetical protein
MRPPFGEEELRRDAGRARNRISMARKTSRDGRRSYLSSKSQHRDGRGPPARGSEAWGARRPHER